MASTSWSITLRRCSSGSSSARGGGVRVREAAAAGHFVEELGEGAFGLAHRALGEVEAVGEVGEACAVRLGQAPAVFLEQGGLARGLLRRAPGEADAAVLAQDGRGHLAQGAERDVAGQGAQGGGERGAGRVGGAQDPELGGERQLSESGVLERVEKRPEVHDGEPEGAERVRDDRRGGAVLVHDGLVGELAEGEVLLIHAVVGGHVGAREEGGHLREKPLLGVERGHVDDGVVRQMLVAADLRAGRKEAAQDGGDLLAERAHHLIDLVLRGIGHERGVERVDLGRQFPVRRLDRRRHVELVDADDVEEVLLEGVLERLGNLQRVDGPDGLGAASREPLGHLAEGGLDRGVVRRRALPRQQLAGQIVRLAQDVQGVDGVPREGGARQPQPPGEDVLVDRDGLVLAAFDGGVAPRVGLDLGAVLGEDRGRLCGGARGEQALAKLRAGLRDGVEERQPRPLRDVQPGDGLLDLRDGAALGRAPFDGGEERVADAGGRDGRRGGVVHRHERLGAPRFGERGMRGPRGHLVRTEHRAHVAGDLVEQRPELVRQAVEIVPVERGPDGQVPLLRGRGGDVGPQVVRNLRPLAGGLRLEHLHHRVCAQVVAAHGAVQLRERQREGDRLGLRDAVDARERVAVGDPRLLEHPHRRRARPAAGLRLRRGLVEPREARLLARQRGEHRAGGAFHVRGAAPARKADDRLLELAHVVLLAHAGRDADALARRVDAELDHRLALRARLPLARFEDLRELGAGLREEGLRVLGGAEVDVARDHRLGVGHALVLRRAVRAGERGVHRVALPGAVRTHAVRAVDLGRRADGRGAGRGAGVDRRGVAVEDLAHLLAREGLDAALVQRLVRAGLGREAEVVADAGDLVRAHAAVGERLHEGVLHGQHLRVGDGLGVGAPEVDVVVDLAELGLALEPHLAGVVLAGGDALELLQRDVDAGKVDGHGGKRMNG